MVRRLLVSLFTLALAVPVVVLGQSRVAGAGDGLSYRSTTTYTIDAQSGVVHVLAEITLTNTIPDKRDGNYINRRYFTGFSLPAPVGAVSTIATTGNGRGLGLSARYIPGNSSYYLLDIDLASNLFYQQTAQVRVTYDMTGLPPRSENPSRVNAAYAAFDAFGIGDDGKVTVRVVVPPGFTTDVFGDDAVITQENGNTVYTATNIPNPEEFDIFVSARNDGGLLDTPVETPTKDKFDLRSWPGDTEWQTFVTQQIQEGVPKLQELIGQDWPISEQVEVREAYTPYLYGYAGWFSASDNEIEIGEDLNQAVVLHELSHAWFNDGWFVDRWLSEGFAQVYSNKATEAMGGTPETSDAPGSIGKVSLNEWGDPNFTDGADSVETYGYNASFWVLEQITDEIGEDKMREVLAAVADKTTSYPGEGAPEQLGLLTDWRRFLDLVDQIGGSKKADELFVKYVVSTKQKDTLETRAAARSAYQQLVDDGGKWAPPALVRDKMTKWSFTAATDAMDASEKVLDKRDELDKKAATLGVGYPDTLEATYEAADRKLDDADKAVQAQLDSADQVLAAVAADAQNDNFFDKVGLWGTNLPLLLTDAKAAFAKGDLATAELKAQQVIDTVQKAPGIGKHRTLLAAGGLALFLLLLILLIVLLRRRGRRKRQAATTAAEAAAAELAAGAAATAEAAAEEGTLVTDGVVTPQFTLDGEIATDSGPATDRDDTTDTDPTTDAEPAGDLEPLDTAEVDVVADVDVDRAGERESEVDVDRAGERESEVDVTGEIDASDLPTADDVIDPPAGE